MPKVNKNRKVKAVPKEVPAKIAGFRNAKKWTAQQMATQLGLSGPNIIYAWESGMYQPSAEHYIALANLAAPEWRHIEWFLRQAGVQDRTLKQAADMWLHRSESGQIAELIETAGEELTSAIKGATKEELRDALGVAAISPLRDGELLKFPVWALQHPASTRYLKTGNGDLLLIDTLHVDLRQLSEGTLIAVDSGMSDPTLGILRRQDAGQGVQHYLLHLIERASGDAFLGSSVDGGPLELTSEGLVLGRVAVWVTPTVELQNPKRKKK